jgi:hypothetical protein
MSGKNSNSGGGGSSSGAEPEGATPLQRAASAASTLRESASGKLSKATSAANVLRESASGGLSKAAVSLKQNVPFIKQTESNVSAASGATQKSDISQTSQLEEYDMSDRCPKLTYQQRVIGFFSSFGAGCKCRHFFNMVICSVYTAAALPMER